MIKIWLLIQFFVILRSVILRRYKYNTLGCGLIGYCGSKPADPNILKIIMLYNLERGEDATGWAIDNKITKDTEKAPKFIETNKLETLKEHENYTIVAHVRKSSSGSKFNKQLAHPFGKYSDATEKDKFDIILAMNGTMTNIEEFAKEYKTPFVRYTNSDTEILTTVMAQMGTGFRKAIEGIEGAATLVFFDPNKPNTLMVYKDPERSLYLWQKSKNELYISSIESPFAAIGAGKDQIFRFEDNHLYYIEKGIIRTSEKITRNPIKSKSVFPKSTYSGGYGGHWEGYESCSPTVLSAVKNKSKQIENGFNPVKTNGISIDGDKYLRNGHPIDGIVYINPEGKINVSPPEDALANGGFVKYFFVNGYMLKDEDAYDKITVLTSGQKGKFDKEKFKSIQISTFCEYFKYPVFTYCKGERIILYQTEIGENNKTHTIERLFDDHKYFIRYDGKRTQNKLIPVFKIVSEVKIKKESPTQGILTLKEEELSKDSSFTFLKSEEVLTILKSHPMADAIDHIVKKVTEFPLISSQALYESVCMNVWKANPTANLNKLYKYIIIKVADIKNVINVSEKETLIATIKRGSFVEKQTINSMENLFNELKAKLRQPEKKKENPKEANYSNAEIIMQSSLTNSYYNITGFTDDIYDGKYSSTYEMHRAYVSSANIMDRDIEREFYEGFLQALNFVKAVSDDEVIEYMEGDINFLASKTNLVYQAYIRKVKMAAKQIESIDIEEDVDDESIHDNDEDGVTIAEKFGDLVDMAKDLKVLIDEKGKDATIIDKGIGKMVDFLLTSDSGEVKIS